MHDDKRELFPRYRLPEPAGKLLQRKHPKDQGLHGSVELRSNWQDYTARLRVDWKTRLNYHHREAGCRPHKSAHAQFKLYRRRKLLATSWWIHQFCLEYQSKCLKKWNEQWISSEVLALEDASRLLDSDSKMSQIRYRDWKNLPLYLDIGQKPKQIVVSSDHGLESVVPLAESGVSECEVQ